MTKTIRPKGQKVSPMRITMLDETQDFFYRQAIHADKSMSLIFDDAAEFIRTRQLEWRRFLLHRSQRSR